MRIRSGVVRLAALGSAAVAMLVLYAPALAPAESRVPGERFRSPVPVRGQPRITMQERRLAEATKAFAQGRIDEARERSSRAGSARKPRSSPRP